VTGVIVSLEYYRAVASLKHWSGSCRTCRTGCYGPEWWEKDQGIRQPSSLHILYRYLSCV